MDDLETKPEGNKTDNGDVNPDEDDDDDDDDDKAEEEDNVDDGILFYVNKDGLPMRHDTWQRMWSHAARLYPDAAKTINTIRNTAPEGEVGVFRIIVAMPHCLNAPRPECPKPSRNAPTAKSQCPNREVAMLQPRSRNAPTAKSQCPTFGRNAPVILLLLKHVKT